MNPALGSLVVLVFLVRWLYLRSSLYNRGYFFEFFRRARSARHAMAEKPEKISLLCRLPKRAPKKIKNKINKTLTLFECQCNEYEITKILEVVPPI